MAGLGRSGGVGAHSKAASASRMTANDVSSVLLSEVATSDISRLAGILNPAPSAESSRILDALLSRAVQEVAKGNGERAVGYLADYATRDPRRAESLLLEPELAPVRDKIDSMVSRMTQVAKMSAEDGLSRAEQSASQSAGKLSNWDTNADVLLKVAHQIFDAGGYANYSRTSDLARAVTDAVSQSKHVPQALAASASAGPQTNQIPGVNVPYWAAPDMAAITTGATAGLNAVKRDGDRDNLTGRGTPSEDSFGNVRGSRDIGAGVLRMLWARAPLLLMMLAWFFLGLWAGVAFFIASRIWPDGLFAALGDFVFELWGLGLLALVGFGFYVRVRYRR